MVGPRTGCCLCRNPSSSRKDELAGGLPGAPTKDNNTPTLSSAVSRAQTPVPPFNKGLFQQFMKDYLENQNQNQNQASPSIPIQVELWEQPLKAQFPNLYYENFHLDCYCFCQQYNDHFDTVGANGPNCILFVASFLPGLVVQHWH